MFDLLASVQAVRRQHALWLPGATLIVAVSGGPDSLCLLHVLHQLAPREGLRLHVAHLNHKLRPNADDDAYFVAALAAQWQIATTIGERNVAALARSTHLGIEAAARQARYQFFADVAVAEGAAAVALGHTADDQAETVMLRLLRGAGPTGLAAMRPHTTYDNGLVIVRPLLTLCRATVLAYCAQHDLQPRHDPSNADPVFTRNRVRAELLPLLSTYNPAIVAALNRTAQVCADEDDYLTYMLDQQWSTFAQVAAERVSLDRDVLLALHPALRRRALRRAVHLLGPLTEVGGAHLDRMLARVEQGSGQQQLPGKRWLRVQANQIIVEWRDV